MLNIFNKSKKTTYERIANDFPSFAYWLMKEWDLSKADFNHLSEAKQKQFIRFYENDKKAFISEKMIALSLTA